MDTEDAAKCAKETVYGDKMFNVDKIRHLPNLHSSKADTSKVKSKNSSAKRKSHQDFPHGTCGRCGSTKHIGKDCKFRNAECQFCMKTGHIEKVCLQKQKSGARRIETLSHVTKTGAVPQLRLEVQIRNKKINFEIDTGSSANFISSEVWHRIGQLSIEKVQEMYQSASKHKLPVLGSLNLNIKGSDSSPITNKFILADVPDLNILGRNAIRQLNISMDDLLLKEEVHKLDTKNNAQTSKDKPSVLLKTCEQLCDEFPSLFSPGLGVLKDFELVVKFKEDATPVFLNPVPYRLPYKKTLKQNTTKVSGKECGNPQLFVTTARLLYQSERKIRKGNQQENYVSVATTQSPSIPSLPNTDIRSRYRKN